MVAATWKADQVPQADGELAFHLYEGASHASRAKYQYWARAGYAGCVLNARHRMRLGLPNSPEALVSEMFAQQV